MYLKNKTVWGKSDTGCKRKHNEDRFCIEELPEITILGVADGIAGSAGGEVAAQIVVDTIRDYKFSKTNLETDLHAALVKAEKRIYQNAKKNPALDGMGTTASISVLYENKVFWIHVGDSRIYLLHDKSIKQITTDHTFIQDLIDDGSITPGEAKRHPLRNMLDQCVGCDELQPDSGVFTAEKKDRLLICSDGLTKHLSDEEIKSILKTRSLREAGGQLIQTALKKGGTDNVTVILKDFC